MHVMLASDNGYVLPLVVTAYSMLKNLRSDADLTIHIITEKLLDGPRAKLNQFIKKWESRADFKWTEIDASAAKALQLSKVAIHISAGTYYRFQISEVIPSNVSKALYVDTDVMVLSDISKLFSLEMKKPLLAVCDPYVPTLGSLFGIRQCGERFGLNPEAPYFNAGLMMLDLNYWRENRIEQQAVKYLNDNRDKVVLVDQEALNYVYYQKWEPIEPTWNWMYRPFQDFLPLNDVPNNKWFFELLAKKAKPNIVHFAGLEKPWDLVSGHPDTYQYLKLMFESGWFTDKEMISMGLEKSLS